MLSRTVFQMKKKPISQSNRFYAGLWVLFHAGIILAFAVSLFLGRPLSVDADLFHMLPSSTLGKAMGEADEKLSEATSRNVFVLFSHEDFEAARLAAETAYGRLKDNEFFTSVQLYADASALSEIQDFIHPYRWRLLSDSEIAALEEDGGPARFADTALAGAYGAFSLSSLDYIYEDPFMLDEYAVRRYMAAAQDAGTSMRPKDGVLASEYEGRWYVMIRGSLTKEGAAIARKESGISAIYDACSPLEKDGIKIVYSGPSFHSYYSSNSAVKEITLISAITLSLVVIMLLAIFKSALPIAASVAGILVSVAAAFSATHLIFGQIHILTLVLGTSLIGSCIDYSLHFFINWKANTSLGSGRDVRSYLLKGLSLSLASTLICYLSLVFAPFGLLKQMGVFSFTGILSSFLSVTAIYPLFRLQSPEKRNIPLLKFYREPGLSKKRNAWIWITLAAVSVTGTVLFALRSDLRIENDMNRLYVMKGRLKDDTELSAKVTGYNAQGWFIISGDSEEELLQTEEALCSRLDALRLEGKGSAYLSLSRFVPSLEKQERSLAAARRLLPLLPEQMSMLGFDSEDDIEAVISDFENSPVLLPGEALPDAVSSIPSMLWLGRIEGRHYSVVLPVSSDGDAEFRQIASEMQNVYYENKMDDLGKGLDGLTRLIALLFAAAYAVIIIVLKFFYPWRETLKIASIPLLSVLVILTVFVVFGIPIEFFAFTGMILVFGLGLDYVIYMMENLKRASGAEDDGSRKLEPFAILISFITTAVSFGALSLSTFVPVHTMGLTIFLGLVTAFLCTLF